MAVARSNYVDLSVTPYYHCMSRCVRQAYLCGKDAHSGQNYEHRREWVRDRLRCLSRSFAIDILAYAVMSNHLHVVVRVNAQEAEAWDDQEVVARYGKLFRGAPGLYEGCVDAKQQAALVEQWRSRLMDVSWMMRTLNEHIARKANKEDGTKGRFWEGRFRSQPVLDEQGLLMCMAYVDLNPVRAKLASSLEGSEFTSIQERLFESARNKRHRRKQRSPEGLAPFSNQEGGCAGDGWVIPQDFAGYVELLEWTGSALVPGKGGVLEGGCGGVPELLERSGIGVSGWFASLGALGVGSATFLGSAQALEERAASLGRRWLRGVRLARQLAA